VDSAQPDDRPDFDESANDEGGVDDTLRPMEALDSDEVRNDDGDTVVDPPDQWSEAERPDDDRTLDDRLAEEVPDQPGAGGTPEDGDSLFPVVE
jgi:hypothetical protein